MKHFLLVYDRKRGLQSLRVFSETEFGNAMAERFRLEKQYVAHTDIEIVVLSADSEEALKRTHGRYFRSPSDLTATG